jgi:GT2 family glycosyltransferase
MTKLYFIIVNYKSENDTLECLQSVLHQDYSEYQVVVVDNSPDDIGYNKLKDWAGGNLDSIDTGFPELVYPINKSPLSFDFFSESELVTHQQGSDKKWIFIKADKNEGFSAANNIALRFISTSMGPKDYCWLLNNDTVISKDASKKVVAFIDEQSTPSIFGTSLMEYDSPSEIQSIAGGYDPKFSRLTIFKTKEELSNSKVINYPNGASLIVSSKFLKVIGLLEEKYFLYFEELDWVLRAKQNNLKPKFLVDEIVYHKGGASTGKNSILADYYYLRSRFLITKTFFQSKVLQTVIVAFLVFPFNRMMRGQLNRIYLVFRVFGDVFIKNEADTFRRK